MKKIPWKKILIVSVFGVGAYALYSIYKAFATGERTVMGLLKAPFTFAGDAASAIAGGAAAVGSDAAAAASIPALTQQSQALDTQITSQNDQDYAPGGKIYTQILNTQGQAAADAAWAKVQADDSSMTAQTGTWWNPFSW